MKKLLKLLAITSVSFVLASAARAVTWTDDDPLNVFLTSSRHGNDTYSNTFNILDAGYNPATQQVTSAVASFAFADNATDEGEYVDILLDSTLIFNDLEVDGTSWSYDWHSVNVSGSLLASLQDGVLNYTVKIDSGDTYLKGAKLVAQGGARSVPDSSSTAVLVGLGLVSLFASRKRFW